MLMWIHEEQRYGDEQDVQDAELKVFGGMLDEAMQHGILPEGGMPESVIDMEEWMIQLFRNVGQDDIADYWSGNLNMVRGYEYA